MGERLDPKRLVASAPRLASPPVTFHRITETMSDNHITVDGIVGIVRVDQALVTRLLKVANSPTLGFPGKIETIERAVMILGTKHMRDLALAMLAIEHFAGMSAAGVDPGSFWRHSLAVAVNAKLIAARLHDENPERLFLTGLLHEVGSLLLFQMRPELAMEALNMYRKTDQSLSSCERSVFGCDHADIGSELLRQMGLPRTISDAVSTHHGGNLTQDGAIIHVADLIIHALELGNSGEYRVPTFSTMAWDMVGMPVHDIEPLAREGGDILRETEELFFPAGSS